jgi:hypothetical protein
MKLEPLLYFNALFWDAITAWRAGRRGVATLTVRELFDFAVDPTLTPGGALPRAGKLGGELGTMVPQSSPDTQFFAI